MKTIINLEEKQHLFGGIFQHQISDDETSGLIRVIDYLGANISQRYQCIEHDAKMYYFNKNGDHLPKFTHKVMQRSREWKVDNSYTVKLRDFASGEVLTDEDGNELTSPAFDYYVGIIFSIPLALDSIIQNSIELDDAYKLFDV